MGIGSLLERYKHLRPPDESVRIAVQDALLKHCNAKIPLAGISVDRRGVVRVSSSPTLRLEIALKQEDLMVFLQERCGAGSPTRVL